MKLNKIILSSLLLGSIVISACSGPTNTSSGSLPEQSNSQSDVEYSSTQSDTQTSEPSSVSQWDSDLSELMIEVLGVEIPYVELDSSTLFYGVDEDETGEYIYIYDESETNLLTNYDQVLAVNSYELESEEYEGYRFAYKGDLWIQYGYYPGDEEYPAGNEIYAWIEPEEGGEVTPSSDWPNDLSTLMLQILGEEIPFFVYDQESILYGFDTDATGDYIYIVDSSNVNNLADYGDTLIDHGYSYAETDNSYGYDVYFYVKDTLIIQYAYNPGDDTYSAGHEVFAWIDPSLEEGGDTGGDNPGGEVTPTGEWPTDLSTLMLDVLGEELPVLPLDEITLDYYSDIDETGEYIYIYDYSLTDNTASFATILEDNGYTYLTTDDTYGYDMVYYFKGDLFIQYDYYPGDEEYPAGHDIYAWVDSSIGEEGGEEGGDDVETIIPEGCISIEEALEIGSTLGADESTTEKYQIFGQITEIDEPYTTQYKNISFYMGDFLAHRVKLATGTLPEDLVVGAYVIVTGEIFNYQGKQIEIKYGTVEVVEVEESVPSIPVGTLTEWPSEIEAYFEEIGATEIPVAPLDSATVAYQDMGANVYGYIVSVYDISEEYTLGEYEQTLIDEGWTFIGIDDYGYKIFTKENTRIEVGYFEGSDDIPAGNDIWVYGWYGDTVVTKQAAYEALFAFAEISEAEALPDIPNVTDYYISGIYQSQMSYTIAYVMIEHDAYVEYATSLETTYQVTYNETYQVYEVKGENCIYYLGYYGGAMSIEVGPLEA